MLGQPINFSDDIEQFNESFEKESISLFDELKVELQDLSNKKKIEDKIVLDNSYSTEYRLECMLKQSIIQSEINKLEKDYEIKFAALRYKKGIEILKMLYEKVLALDHHFTSLNTIQSISDLSNPNSYPEFAQAKEIIEGRAEKKSSTGLPNFLKSNTYVTLITSVISSFIGDGNKRERSKEIASISCMLDFTIDMYSDLKVIHFETEYLRLNNQELLDACSQLFREYTKTIGYRGSLVVCRDSDDWDEVNNKLDNTINSLLDKNESGSFQDRRTYLKELNNIEFSMDRLLNFMDDYSEFVNNGENYYQKFSSIVSSYKHKEICVKHLPKTYADLEKEIELSIEKFNTAYKIAELQGTKLRDLLYGIPE